MKVALYDFYAIQEQIARRNRWGSELLYGISMGKVMGLDGA